MSEIRVDRNSLPKMTRTPEGYLRGEAIVTRTGVFRYLNADGSERLELRHPDDILRDESLTTLRQIPITVDHPAGLVSADNAADLSVGMTGESIRIDGPHIIAPLHITDKPGIEAIDKGTRELSLGYVADVEPETGEYNGQPYTHRQRNVRYNHCAIVAQARAGALARVNLDGAAVQFQGTSRNDGGDKMTAKVTLDGIEYEAAPEVRNALEKAQKRADEIAAERDDAKRTLADMQKEYDALQGKMDALKEEMDAMKEKRGDAAIAEAAKARVALLTRAGKIIDTAPHLDASDREIMEAAIKARNDSLDLSGKSDDYVAARFDAVIEAAEAAQDGIRKQAEKAGARVDGESRTDALEKARNEILNMWKGEAA